MASIYSTAQNDGYIASVNATNWAGARDATDGTGSGRTSTRATTSITSAKFPARGGGYSWRINRSFLWFDTSGVSETDSGDAIILYLYGFFTTTADFFAVKSTHSVEFTTAIFDSIEGWSAGVDNEGNVTKYNDTEVTSWTHNAYNTITLNSAARTDIEDDDIFKVCLIEYDYDLKNVEPGTGVSAQTGMYYSDYTGTSRDPYIKYTPAAAADNATFFGANF